jgi:DNA polymerase-3 subunit epsilon
MTTFTAIDFETADHGRDSACAVGAVVVRDGVIAERYHRLIRPPRQRMVFTYIHGLSWDDVKDAPCFADIWPELGAVIEASDFLAAHNAPFDRGVLNGCCQAAAIRPPRRRFVCTVQLARAAWRLPSAKLPAVCAHLGIPLRHHDPLSDAEACARIALAALAEGVSLSAP